MSEADRHRLGAAVVAAGFIGLLGLTGIATRRFRAHEAELARTWEGRAQTALRGGRPADAVDAYRNAVFYSRHDVRTQRQLAQALLAAGRPREARPYLVAAWRDDPTLGAVNLHLARLDAADGRNADAVRHYRGAIHGVWDEGQEPAREQARREIIALLTRTGARQRAVAEVIDWEGTLAPDDAAGRLEAGSMLLRLDEPRLALSAYREALRLATSSEALVGAAAAASRIGEWRLARAYLRRAPERDAAAERLLQVAEHAVALDPWAPRLRLLERGRRARLAIEATRERVAGCDAALGARAPSLLASLEAASSLAGSRARAAEPESLDAALAVVRHVQEAASSLCGPLRPVDEALLALARAHIENEPDDDAPRG